MQGRRFLEEGQVGDDERKRELPGVIRILRLFKKILVEMSNGHLDVFGPGAQMKSMYQKYKSKSH